MKRITPCLWFDTQAEEAASFYTSIFKDSKIKHIARYGDSAANDSGRPKGSVMTVLFELAGQEFMALNGGPMFKFTEAVSFMVMCENQDEVDRYWQALLQGGEESQCGWLKDKFGLSWQVVPTAVNDMMRDKDPVRAERVMKAILGMRKIDLAELEAAYAEK